MKQEEEYQARLSLIRDRLDRSANSGQPVPLDQAFEQFDNNLIMDVTGVAQAIDQLRKALNKVEKCLDQRKFEEASSLGYSDVSSAFIFLQ